MDKLRKIEWSEFCEWVQGRRVQQQTKNDDYSITVLFADGAEAQFISHWELTAFYALQQHPNPPSIHVTAESKTPNQHTVTKGLF